MVLLSQLIRTAAITGRTDNLAEWFAGRQGGRWAEQTVRSAVPPAGASRPGPPPQAPKTSPSAPDPAEALRELTQLHERGVLTDAEFEGLRAQLRV
jgi:Short C-terminal domain